jgi:hypothetical protein
LLSIAFFAVWCAVQSASGQEADPGDSEKVKPVTLRVGVPTKNSEREVVFPLIVEMSGTASVGRIRAELEVGGMQGWSFRDIEITRGLDLRTSVKKRNEDARLVIEWDVSAQGKELPTGHLALLRVQADRAKTKSGAPSADNPPMVVLRKLSWGLAEFEKPPETMPEINTPDNVMGNPAVSCFFFTH